MDFDDILREKEETILQSSEANQHTWENALLAASRFSAGRLCSKGKGTKSEGKSFPSEPRRDGSFNICYWVSVEGADTQWVVRFPKPIASDSVIQMKLRSEVATLQFLYQSTRVPVPKVIGYGEGDKNLPPFLIMENIDGMRLSLLWMGGNSLRQPIVDKILRSLAEIQFELLLHPFNKIGMLDIATDSDDGPTVINVLSLDALEHCRDGVRPIIHSPFTKASEYYVHKLEVWNSRLREQRNSVSSHSDGRRKFISGEIVREFLTHCGGPVQDEGPFYLVHPDLHGKNVIIDPGEWSVKAIIDWEGACILPLESARSPPKCLHNTKPTALLLGSNDYQNFLKRLQLYSHQFSLVAQDHGKALEFQISNSITTTLFFTWAIDDVRDFDQLIWQHIAPSIYTELKRRYDSILDRPERDDEGPLETSIEYLLTDFVEGLYCSGRYDTSTLDHWIKRKLEDLEIYRREFQNRQIVSDDKEGVSLGDHTD